MKRRRRVRVDGVYDLECARWDRFVVGVTHHVAHGVEVHYTITSLVDRLLSLGGTWWSHNGGTYDALAVAEELRQRGAQMSFSLSGSRVSRATGSGLTLCDSYALIPLGLDVAAEIAGLPAYVLGWTCECGRSCGGYCQISLQLSTSRLSELADYCVRDCETLLATLEALQRHADTHDYDLCGTIGGSAWATARRLLELPDADIPSGVWRRLRSAYHGGRVSVFRPRVRGSGRHWDLSSAYPAALATTALPCGDASELGAREALAALKSRSPGVYACTVRIPDVHVPPLPWSWRGGIGYPVGEVSGVWPLPELEAAIERGAEVDRVSWAITWPESRIVFGDLMRAWTDVRAAVGKRSALGAWQRLLANSLTGKLAEQPHRRFVRLHPPIDQIKRCTRTGPCLRRCVGACDAYQQLDLWGELWTVPYYRPATSGHLQWAAYLTAETRLAWLRGAESQGMDLVYGDTDSLWTTSKRMPAPAGDALGEWSLKHGWEDWECAAPKSYAYTDGDRVVRSAGARLTPSEWTDGSASQDRGVVSLVSAAKRSRGLFRAAHQQWTLPAVGRTTGWYGDRLLDATRGVTHPVTCEQLRKSETGRRTTR